MPDVHERPPSPVLLADHALQAARGRSAPRRPGPAADSRLVKAITATVSANTRSDHFGAVPRWIGSSSACGLKNSDQPEHDDERLQRAGRRPPAARRAARGGRRSRGCCRARRSAMNASASPSASPRSPERAPEDPQVLRRRVGRDGDQDDVVEQDRPAGDEAHELVEGVAGEHRRAAAVLVQRGALHVGHRRQREQQRRDQEHERRQPERVPGDHPEREVDRARQRGVDDREQDRRADAAPQRSRASAPPAPPPCARASAPRVARTRSAPRAPPAARRPPAAHALAAPAQLEVAAPAAGRDEQHPQQQPRPRSTPPCPLERLHDQRRRR